MNHKIFGWDYWLYMLVLWLVLIIGTITTSYPAEYLTVIWSSTIILFTTLWIWTSWLSLHDDYLVLDQNKTDLENEISELHADYVAVSAQYRVADEAFLKERQRNDDLLQEIHDLTHGTDAYKAKDRDDTLELLQKRLANLNQEYNNKPAKYRTTVLSPELLKAKIPKKNDD